MIIKCPQCGYQGPLRDEMQTLSAERGSVPARSLVESRVLVPVLRAFVWCAVAAVVCGVLRVDPRVTVTASIGAFVVSFAVGAGDPEKRTWGTAAEDSADTQVDDLFNENWRSAGLIASGDTLRREAIAPRGRMRAVYRVCAREKWSARVLHGVDGMSQREARELMASMVSAGLLSWRQGQPNHPDGALLSESGQRYGERLLSG